MHAPLRLALAAAAAAALFSGCTSETGPLTAEVMKREDALRGKSPLPVKKGDTQAAVEAALGKPTEVKASEAKGASITLWIYRKVFDERSGVMPSGSETFVSTWVDSQSGTGTDNATTTTTFRQTVREVTATTIIMFVDGKVLEIDQTRQADRRR
jgi:hypothetical protein